MDAPSKIRILAVDDHPLIRAGLSAFLGTEAGMEVIAEASNGEEAIERYREFRPDIVLMDLSMPVMDGLAATRVILDEFPDARVIVLTTFDGDENIHRALEAGARSYLVKDLLGGEMTEVIRAVSQGGKGVPPAVAARLAEYGPRVPLTPRETEVLSLVARGLSNAEVAERFGRAEGTVKVHLKNILQKLGVDGRTDAITTAMRHGFIRLGDSMPADTGALQAALTSRYRIEHELGRGGMAIVYLACDLKHDRPVALKILHPELAASLGAERFQREVRFAARLQHPHILTVLDSGEAAGQLWFSMPYVEGETLRERLQRECPMSIDAAVRIGREAALALDYAHQHGVIHRDIKPENLLLTQDGSTLVADFGLARSLAAGDSELTLTGMAIGTPAYMSPEQASGARDLDARTDIYSLGAVLYEMLAGEPPFTAPTAAALIALRFTETPRPLGTRRDHLSEALQQVVTKALARDPTDRFSTAGQFAQALAQTLLDRSPTPVQDSRHRNAWRRWLPVAWPPFR